MGIKLKDILEVVPDNEYVHLYGPGLVFEEYHVSGKAVMFRKYFPELGDRCVDRLGVCDRLNTCKGDLTVCLLPAGEEV